MSQAAVFTHADGKFPFCLADKQACAHTHTEREHIKGEKGQFFWKTCFYLLTENVVWVIWEKGSPEIAHIHSCRYTQANKTAHSIFFQQEKDPDKIKWKL